VAERPHLCCGACGQTAPLVKTGIEEDGTETRETLAVGLRVQTIGGRASCSWTPVQPLPAGIARTLRRRHVLAIQQLDAMLAEAEQDG
jgi:hypothetical protein